MRLKSLVADEIEFKFRWCYCKEKTFGKERNPQFGVEKVKEADNFGASNTCTASKTRSGNKFKKKQKITKNL